MSSLQVIEGVEDRGYLGEFGINILAYFYLGTSTWKKQQLRCILYHPTLNVHVRLAQSPKDGGYFKVHKWIDPSDNSEQKTPETLRKRKFNIPEVRSSSNYPETYK